MSDSHQKLFSSITQQTNQEENNENAIPRSTPQYLEKQSMMHQFQNQAPDFLNTDTPSPLMAGCGYHNFVIEDTPESISDPKNFEKEIQSTQQKSSQNIGWSLLDSPIFCNENEVDNDGIGINQHVDEDQVDDFNNQINDFQVENIAHFNSSDESEDNGSEDWDYESDVQDDSEEQLWDGVEQSAISSNLEVDNLSEQIEDLTIQRKSKNAFDFQTSCENDNANQQPITKKSTPYDFDKEYISNRRKNVQFVDLINDLSPINEEDSSPKYEGVKKTGINTVATRKLTENTPYSGKYAYQSPEELPGELQKLCKTLEDQFVTPATSKDPSKQVPTSTSIRRSLFSLTPATKTQQSVNAFKKNRDTIARSFFREFNERVCGSRLPDNLEITWSEHKRTTAGSAGLSKKIGNVSSDQSEQTQYIARIELSSKILDTEERLRSTLCHELCHVAAWLIDHNRKPPHGPVFKKWGLSASQKFPGITVRTCHNYDIHVPHVWKCESCFKQYRRHSKSIDTTKFCCSLCKGSLEYVGKFNIDGTPAKTQRPNAYSLFVQSNFSKVKESCEPKTPHSAVIKKLSEMSKNEKENLSSQPR
eukprot:TRINITY_DN3378_c0_g1_i10.p1 TRINITY_DN3378_c0_g1~~TRINITY_DN3378_c0_g1_i10.p1  ORF type:complete len:590 (-),score=58.74 TRINITY_DN3378_c0_g1_i10:220-1989(-)